MRIMETKVYTFNELSDDAKEKAREWFRERGFDYDWYDSVYSDFEEIAKFMGIEVEHIHFSGFWSQGDGACFEGNYRYEKGGVKKLKSYAPVDKELHRIAEGLEQAQKPNNYLIHGTIKHRGNYYHYNSMEIDLHRENCHGDYLDFKGTAEDEITELFKDLAKWLYQTLENEYDSISSDEAIDETIGINDYEFTEEGERA
jgi:hypothetical protein